jgi:nucleotide-binding universal stress UspA family protein
MNLKKILVPVDFPNASLPVIHQAAALAHHFHSEMVMMHVVTMLSHAAGVPEDNSHLAGWNMVAEIIKAAQNERDQTLGPELDGLPIQHVLAKGGASRVIVQASQEVKADLIMMPSRGHTFDQFLLGSAATKSQQGTECPIWTGCHAKESQSQKFEIRSVLCALDFTAQDRKAVEWAAYIAAEFGACLTLAYVTPGVESWGPGGSYVNAKWKEALVSDAVRRIAELQRNMNIKAEVFIGSGDVPKVLCQAAKQTNADLLVTGCRPYGDRLRTHAYAIICAVPIPVLNV